MMKKKKLVRENNAVFIFCRRRGLIHHHHLLPFLSAVASCILFLFALLSFLSPPISDHHFHHNHSSDGIEVRSNVEKQIAFVVPKTEGSLGRDIWSSRQSGLYYGCCHSSDKFQAAEIKTQPGRYLMIATSGGLNQQRTGITDAVVAAYILNATLVVPKLDQKSYWKDNSNFSEIFDVDWFISYLSKDVKIIKQLPTTPQGKVLIPYTTRVPRKCNQGCYLSRILPILEKKNAVQLTKFDYRLSNSLGKDLQKLRCRANYHALRFTDPILEMGRKLVERMRMKSKHFIALHLRYESDMLAFSGCYYGGGDNERRDLGNIRKRWKTLHKGNPDKERRQGRCPLTPEEVGLMLRALGFGSDVHIYVASGEVYGGENTLAPLKALFPNFHSKETIASKEELAPFLSFSARMAAIDFIVCDESDVFVTNNNGNMARMLAGRRRYFGHKSTIRPNTKKLYRLFMDHNNTTWEEFASRVRTFQIGFMGEPNEIKPGRGEFHENPTSCICEKSEVNSKGYSTSEIHNRKGNATSEVIDENFDEEEHEQDWSDMEYLENENGLQVKKLSNRTEIDSSPVVNTEHPELEEMFSD